MNMINSIARVAALTLVGLLSLSAQAASSVVEKANTADWSATNLAALQATFNSPRAVSQFVNRMLETDDIKANLGEFTLADLNNDGKLELICTVDYSGRGFYTTLLVFSKANGKILTSKVSSDGANIVDLDTRLADLNKDGKEEILVPRLLEPYAGADPVAIFTDVYTLRDNTLVKSNQQFREYYRSVRLPALTAKLNQLRAQNTGTQSASVSKAIDALEKEAAAINNLLAE